MVKLHPALNKQRTMLQAYEASLALQGSFEDDYKSIVDFYLECMQVGEL